MDSAGNEVIIVDDRAQTNGFNGNYSGIIEEVSEMKTRSKASGGPGEAAKLRSSSRTNATVAAAASSNGSNSHAAKNDERTSASAPAAAPAPSSVISGSSSDKDKKMSLRSGVADPQVELVNVVSGGKSGDASIAGGSKKSSVESTPAAASKRKGAGSVGDREDDSGINSRSSSVSTDDTYSSRLRTRSKRSEPALSSSTPASTRKASSRMPLSTYDFDDDSIILEEDPSTSASSLKRKATKVLVEEMDDDEAGKGEGDDEEPPVKVTVIQRTSFFNVLLNPLKAIRGRIFVGWQQQPQSDEKSAAKDDVASQTNVSKINDDDPQTEHAASQTDHHNEATTANEDDAKEATGTCMVM